MKKAAQHTIRFLYKNSFLVALFLFASSWIADYFLSQNIGVQSKLKHEVNELLNDKEKELEEVLYNDDFITSFIVDGLTPENENKLNKYDINVYVYKYAQLRTWSSNDLDPFSQYFLSDKETKIVNVKNGYYLLKKRKINDYEVIAFYKFFDEYNIQNKYLINQFTLSSNINIKAKISTQNIEGFDKISTEKSHTDLYVKATKTESKRLKFLVAFLFLGSIYFYVFFTKKIFLSLIRKRKYALAVCQLLVQLFAIHLFFITTRFPSFLMADKMFTPEVYASNIASSLGILLVDVCLVLIFVFNIYQQYFLRWKPNLLSKKEHLYLIPALYISVFICGYIIVSLFSSVIFDSYIYFDFPEINNFNIYTYISLFLILVISAVFYLILQGAFRFIFSRKTNVLIHVLSVFSALLFSVFAYRNFHISEEYTLYYSYAYIFIISFIIFIVRNQSTQRKIVLSVFSVVLVNSVFFYVFTIKKADSIISLYAAKYSNYKDLDAEKILINMGARISKDNYIKEYFQNGLILPEQLSKHVNDLYFDGYLSKYNIDILGFDTAGFSYKSNNLYSFETINNLLSENAESQVGNYFYFLTKPYNKYVYAAKYDICTQKETLGTLYILLKPKLIQVTSYFDELLVNENLVNNRPDYEYAVYLKDSLLFKNGSFPYGLHFNFDVEKGSSSAKINKNNFQHHIHEYEGDIKVVISGKADSFFKPFNIFSFLLIYAVLIILLFLFVNYLLSFPLNVKGKPSGNLAVSDVFFSNNILNRYMLSRRIQITMLSFVLSILFFTALIFVQFIGYNFSETQKDKMLIRAQSVLNNLEINKRLPLNNMLPEEIRGRLKELAAIYETDLTLFNTKGTLIASSKNRLFSRGLINDKMNAEAFYYLDHVRQSVYTHEEKVGNLVYTSSYLPVFDNADNLIAYLNIPDFKNDQKLSENISSFFVNFINIYLFILLIGVLVAYLISQRIISPLTSLQKNIASIKLGRHNEPINYQKPDEIGQLVSQYNMMLSELELSAEKLAEQEREGAWKEMARQIAHEIKNPLTPMKLSVQHLQQAWKQKRENIDVIFEKVMTVLLQQIDSLSNLAGEFSGFAKMPQPHPEIFEIDEAINSVISLFQTDEIEINLIDKATEKTVWADKEQMGRVFNNIIKNAIQACNENEKLQIDIRLENNDGQLIISIKDYGKGIPDEIKEKIFSPNFSTKTSGMGIGLAISKQIITSSDGEIYFESEAGKGTTFYVSLPVNTEKKEA